MTCCLVDWGGSDSGVLVIYLTRQKLRPLSMVLGLFRTNVGLFKKNFGSDLESAPESAVDSAALASYPDYIDLTKYNSVWNHMPISVPKHAWPRSLFLLWLIKAICSNYSSLKGSALANTQVHFLMIWINRLSAAASAGTVAEFRWEFLPQQTVSGSALSANAGIRGHCRQAAVTERYKLCMETVLSGSHATQVDDSCKISN